MRYEKTRGWQKRGKYETLNYTPDSGPMGISGLASQFAKGPKTDILLINFLRTSFRHDERTELREGYAAPSRRARRKSNHRTTAAKDKHEYHGHLTPNSHEARQTKQLTKIVVSKQPDELITSGSSKEPCALPRTKKMIVNERETREEGEGKQIRNKKADIKMTQC